MLMPVSRARAAAIRQFALLLAVLGLPGLAGAHAVLLGSSPQADQVLDKPPDEVMLNFNENVGPIFIKVLDLKGEEVGAPGDWRVEGNDVFMPLGDALANGTYILTYRVISADTHPVGSTIVFAIGEPIKNMSQSAMQGSGDTGWTWLVAANRVVLYAAMLLAAGSALLLLLMNWPATLLPGIAAQGRLAAIVAGVAYILAVGLGGAEMLMGSAGALLSLETWRQGLQSTLLPSAVVGVPGVVLLYLAFRQHRARPPTALLIVATLLAIGSFLVTGHAATAPPVWLMALVVAVHLVCAAFWFAALRPLWVSTVAASLQESGRVMNEFSQRAVWTVGALFISGAVITWVQVETPANLLQTDYGVRLLSKIAIFFIVLGLASVNKTRLTPRVAAGDAAGADSLRRSIRTEYGLIVLILVVAVSLTLPSPPRTALAQQGAAADVAEALVITGENRGYAVRLEITPGRTGDNMVMFSFADAAGQKVEMQRVDTLWSLPAAGLEGVERAAEKVSPEMFHLNTSDLILPGEWNVTVSAYVDDFTKVNFRLAAEIR